MESPSQVQWSPAQAIAPLQERQVPLMQTVLAPMEFDMSDLFGVVTGVRRRLVAEAA
jgi:hypothetical protein